MSWLLILAATLLATEILFRLPLAKRWASLQRTLVKVQPVISSPRISDHWKEKALQAYSGKIFVGSWFFLFCVAFALLPFAAIVFLGNAIELPVEKKLLSVIGTVGVMFVALAYWILRAKTSSKSKGKAADTAPEDEAHDYSGTDKFLHRMALGSNMLPEVSFDIERAMYLAKAQKRETTGRHVFVSGLARAGTTILMRRIYGTGEFASLTYRHMPFLLAPNLWKKLSGKGKEAEVRQRAHGDGLDHSFDSPEALEEVYWRMAAGDRYIGKDGLRPMDADDDILKGFREYVDCILYCEKGQRYLSKNNNNILRLPVIAQAFPESVILVPFREPLQHAISLKSQHERFLKSDRFTREYMGWLVHREFGATHLPFIFEENGAWLKPEGKPADLEYWLQLWTHVYHHLLRTLPAQALLVSYEDLCASTQPWDQIAARIGVDFSKSEEELRPAPQRDPGQESGEWLEKARALHADLLARARQS